MHLSNLQKIKLIITLLPLFLCYIAYLLSTQKEFINSDILRYYPNRKKSNSLMLFATIIARKEFRNVFYSRLGNFSYICKLFFPPIESCDLGKLKNTGKGFKPVHGFGTVINPNASIGENCTILHNVTIGDKQGKGCPQIGCNVSIGTGAIIIGPITIGNNVKIGAGAIVVNDIPSNSTVIGTKAIIKS